MRRLSSPLFDEVFTINFPGCDVFGGTIPLVRPFLSAYRFAASLVFAAGHKKHESPAQEGDSCQIYMRILQRVIRDIGCISPHLYRRDILIDSLPPDRVSNFTDIWQACFAQKPCRSAMRRTVAWRKVRGRVFVIKYKNKKQAPPCISIMERSPPCFC